MEEEYKIKGIEKILEKVDNEQLARFYEVDIDSNFEEVITEDFKERVIPNNSEIELYSTITENEAMKRIKEGKEATAISIASEFYEEDERKRALYGINYPARGKGTLGDVLFFAVDEPIRESIISNYRVSANYFCGGHSFDGLLMGDKFYEEHEGELKRNHKSSKENRKSMKIIDEYVENFMNEYENVETIYGYGPKGDYKETDEIRAKKEKAEKLILELTGKTEMKDVSLREFIKLKRSLEEKQRELKESFTEKYAGKKPEDRN